MKEWFIYTLEDPRDGAIRYVGKTSRPDIRLREHLKDAARGKQSHRCNWIRGLHAAGVEPEMVFVESGTGEGWQKRERFWIKTLRASCRLVNGTDGGEGASGLVMPDAAKAMLREHRLGAVMSDESKAKLSAHFKGKALSEEHREKMRGRKRSDEARAQMSEVRKKEWAELTPEARAAKISKMNEAIGDARFHQSKNRAVRCCDTGEVFASVNAAAREGGMATVNIRKAIAMGRRTKGRSYEYV